ncbi:MAG: helix-turn-helix domain-containing protein [Omnitrophica WOR_2 bacterium]
MSVNPLAITIRSRKLGVLIRDARIAAGKSIEDCARSIGISPEQFQDYEFGEKSPSLPELEILAYSLNMPVDHFWGNATVSQAGNRTKPLDPGKLLKLRQKMVGVQIRQARQAAGISLDSFADRAGLTIDELNSFELGENPVSFPILEMIAQVANRPVQEFQDHSGPVGAWSAQQRAVESLMELPQDLQVFVCKPVNRPYLELAQRLSEMSVEKLRAVAEGLLEITL